MLLWIRRWTHTYGHTNEAGFWMRSLHPVQQLRNVNSAKLHKHLRAPCFRCYFESKQQRGWF